MVDIWGVKRGGLGGMVLVFEGMGGDIELGKGALDGCFFSIMYIFFSFWLDSF
jgi:hypothetical protein